MRGAGLIAWTYTADNLVYVRRHGLARVNQGVETLGHELRAREPQQGIDARREERER